MWFQTKHRQRSKWVVSLLLSFAITYWYAWVEAPHLGSRAYDLDTLFRERPPRDELVVVHVDEDDFQNLFAGQRPLNGDSLFRLLTEVANARPKAIGVDIDTSDREYTTLRSIKGVPIIWARDFTCAHRDSTHADVFERRCSESDYVPSGFLGGPAEQPDDLSGLAIFHADEDAVVRRYRRTYHSSFAGNIDSFGHAVIKAAGLSRESSGIGEEFLIQFRPQPWRYPFSARDVLNRSASSALRDKVVLVGATYLRAGDRHRTPLGTMPGVDVWAQVLASELDGSPLPAPSASLLGTIMFAEGVLIGLLLQMRSRLKAAVASCFLAGTVALAASYTLSGSFGLWPFFTPLIAVIASLEIYEHIKHHRNEAVNRVLEKTSTLVARRRRFEG